MGNRLEKIKQLIQTSLHAAFFLLLFFLNCNLLSAKTIPVGKNQQFKNLAEAVLLVTPGDTIRFQKGVYPGGQSIKDLKGTVKDWITIYASVSDSVLIRGGTTSWQFTDPAYLRVEGFIFDEQTANGLNVDDGGDYSTPAHHLVFRNCIFRNIKASGNNDLLKLSGLDHFEITGCKFLNGSPGGSGMDMVGCHQGLIESCEFENQGSNSVQAKGGSQYIRIFRNRFINGGQRAVNLGGSTGLPYFRPMDVPFEAANLEVYSNIFIGSDSPVAFVGCINSRVINNTIFKPGRWVVRILQENTNPRFVQCGENTFSNNLIHYGNLRTETNVGGNTRPGTFLFSGNFWFDFLAGQPHLPLIPVNDSTIVFGVNPGFLDAENRNFRLKKDSPAQGKIKFSDEPVTDFYNRSFMPLRSAGAVELYDTGN